MRLDAAQTDRACGVLLGGAAGDALGAGYEFAPVTPDLVPGMVGGGLGGFAPGEWTDDTAQAAAIARVAAIGLDLRSGEALDQIAQGFADWYAGGPADVGIQTSQVLRLAGRTPTGAEMAKAARSVHERTGRSAGNGSLMRTGPVALAHLDDPVALVEAAMAVSALTHYDPRAGQGCAVWCLMIRHAALTGALPTYDDIAEWVPDAPYWRSVLRVAETGEPSEFTQNGWVVGAMQAAWSAITHTPVPAERYAACHHLQHALTTAIRIGHDTDTVAAIAGALLGARWGMSAIPAEWRRILHGWPSLTARDLEEQAVLTVRGGRPGAYGWPGVERIDYSAYATGVLVQHPIDPGVWLGDGLALYALPNGVDAVVSLCLTGRSQVPAGVEQVSFRLIDSLDPAANPNLEFVLEDAARTVARLREEGKRVLIHCVAAQHRTPVVAACYAVVRGMFYDDAGMAVGRKLPLAGPQPVFAEAFESFGLRPRRRSSIEAPPLVERRWTPGDLVRGRHAGEWPRARGATRRPPT